MAAVVMSGAPVADAVLADVGERVAKLAAAGKKVGLGTILVGDDPASVHYVARKHETCERYGIGSVDLRLPAEPPASRSSSMRSTGSTPTPGWTASWSRTLSRLGSTTPRRWPGCPLPRTSTACTPSTLATWRSASLATPGPAHLSGIQAMLGYTRSR